MRTDLLLRFSLELLFAVGLFYFGKLLIVKGRKMAPGIANKMTSGSTSRVSSFFSDFGWACQCAAFLWGGFEAICVLLVV